MTPREKGFDYSCLNKTERQALDKASLKVKSLLRRTTQDIIDIGQTLLEVKQKLAHGQYGKWLEAELGWSDFTARQFINAAKVFKSEKISDLSFDPSALYILSTPSTPLSARQEALQRAIEGGNISQKVAKEIVSRHKSNAEQIPATDEISNPVTPHQTKAKKRAELLEPSGVKPSTSDSPSLLPSTNLNFEDEEEQRAENAIVDISAITISDDPSQVISPKFSIGDRVRILRRQEGEDKWTGCTAKVWEVTQNGWLRVNVEGHQGVKFTLKPDWVQLVEKTKMTEIRDDNQLEAIPLVDKPSNDSDIPETFVISSPSLTAEVKCTPSQMLAILEQIGLTVQNP